MLYNFYARPRHTFFVPPGVHVNDVHAYDDQPHAIADLSRDLTVDEMIQFAAFPALWGSTRVHATRDTGADPGPQDDDVDADDAQRVWDERNAEPAPEPDPESEPAESPDQKGSKKKPAEQGA